MNKDKLDKDKFLLIKGVAGIANRVLCLLSGIVYAQIADRKLIVDWSDKLYSNDGSNIFPKLFTLSNVHQVIEIPNTDSVYPLIWKDNLHKPVTQVRKEHGYGFGGKKKNMLRLFPFIRYKFTINIGNLNYQEKMLVRWSNSAEIQKLQHHLQKQNSELRFYNEKDILKQLIRKHIKLNENIQKRISNFQKENFSEKNIGVHIRYTDRKNPFDKFYTIIDKIIEKSSTDYKIFLATDNKVVERQFKDRYKEMIIVTKKWFPHNTNVLDRLHFHPDCPDKLENAIEALIDLYLLGNCDYLICDQNSSFALLAELISDIPEANIFDASKQRFKTKLKKTLHPIIEVT